jgi:hypothetical protein
MVAAGFLRQDMHLLLVALFADWALDDVCGVVRHGVRVLLLLGHCSLLFGHAAWRPMYAELVLVPACSQQLLLNTKYVTMQIQLCPALTAVSLLCQNTQIGAAGVVDVALHMLYNGKTGCSVNTLQFVWPLITVRYHLWLLALCEQMVSLQWCGRISTLDTYLDCCSVRTHDTAAVGVAICLCLIPVVASCSVRLYNMLQLC